MRATRLLYRLNGGPEILLCSDCPTVWSSPITLGGLAECAPVTVTVIARNLAGNESTVTFNTRVDLTPPVIVCPDNVLASSPAGTAMSVRYPAPTATDNCGGSSTIACTPPAGSAFPMGTTLVQCTATDACGNRADCSFKVHVRDGCLLNIARAVKLTWPCGGVLQGASNPGGPWTDIPGATSPFYDDGTFPWHFYRVQLP